MLRKLLDQLRRGLPKPRTQRLPPLRSHMLHSDMFHRSICEVKLRARHARSSRACELAATAGRNTGPGAWATSGPQLQPPLPSHHCWGEGAGGVGVRSLETVIGPAPKRPTIHIMPGAARLMTVM